MSPTLQKLEALITRVEGAIQSVHDGKKVNLQTMDADSKVLHAELKKQPDPAARPLLLKAVTSLERLAEALEKQIGKKP
ncbi:MAG TPA: hypothetical protein VIN59_03180 [Alphaproteobacteria bacterium]